MCSLCKEEKSWLDSAYKELGLSVWNKYESPSISPWIYTQTSIMDFIFNMWMCSYYWLLIFTFMTSRSSFLSSFKEHTWNLNNLVNNPVWIEFSNFLSIQTWTYSFTKVHLTIDLSVFFFLHCRKWCISLINERDIWKIICQTFRVL